MMRWAKNGQARVKNGGENKWYRENHNKSTKKEKQKTKIKVPRGWKRVRNNYNKDIK